MRGAAAGHASEPRELQQQMLVADTVPCQRCQVVRQLPQVIRVQAEGREGGGIGHLRRQEADAVVGHVEAAQARQRAHGHGHLLQVVV